MREYTGGILETDYLIPNGGQDNIPTKTPEYEYLKDSLKNCITNNPYISKSVEAHDPKARWLNDVHAQVAEALGLEDYSKLKVYPALGLSADRWHGIDFFFVLEDGNKKALLTADLTLRPEAKAGGFKADILITPTGAIPHDEYSGISGFDLPEERGEDQREYRQRENKIRENIGKLIAKIIKYKLREGDPKYRKDVLDYITGSTREQIGSILAGKRRKKMG